MRLSALSQALLLAGTTASTILPRQANATIELSSFKPTSLFYRTPFIDVNEQRTRPSLHTYIHGGFKGTDLLFSLYFPPKETYEGRFFQALPAVPGNEQVLQEEANLGGVINDVLGFAFESGGYAVESNQGAKSMLATIDVTTANGAAAEFGRFVALQIYGGKRPYGYLFGGSGGGYKTIAGMEHGNAWDGAVPFIIGSPASIPNVFTVQGHAMRLLEKKFDQIVDNAEVGGSGDLYAGLNNEEREALAEVTKMGFPPMAWFRHRKIALGYTGVFASLLDTVRMMDSSYFTDYWSLPGYLGQNPPESLKAAKVMQTTKVTKMIKTNEAMQKGYPISLSGQRGGGRDEVPAAFTFEHLPKAQLQGATITFISGAGKGSSATISGVVDNNVALIGFGAMGQGKIDKVQAGDSVTIDNSVYLASLTYHRHQDPGPEYPVWDMFKTQGKHIYPQRKIEMSKMPLSGTGTIQSGKFAGKVIVVEAGYDEAAYPWQGDWYRRQVEKHLGDKAKEQFRIWMCDKTMHTSPEPPQNSTTRPAETTRIVSYAPIIQQALRDVAAWVENGIAPPSNSNYKVNDGQVILAETAAERGSIQPVVTLTVNGKERADVGVGTEVKFEGKIAMPPGTGSVIASDFDFEGEGTFPVKGKFTKTGDDSAMVTESYAFKKPGTYFPALMGVGQRNTTSKFGLVANLGRVRVVVT